MESPSTDVQDNEAPVPAPARKLGTPPDFSVTALPIGQLTERADWPQCALGIHVSIHGFEGVVVEIINQSFKVVAHDRTTQRFNAGRLKTLFAPPERPKSTPFVEPPKPVVRAKPVQEESEPEPEPPARVYIAEPDFSQPVRPIRAYAGEGDFPQCAYGKHVDIPGYSGVVVEIVKGSLKVQSEEGSVRSFNGATLKKLYGRD
jgi:hypothetical protein